MPTQRLFAAFAVASLLPLFAPAMGAQETPAPLKATAPAYASDPKFVSAMKDAAAYQQGRRPDAAIDSYKKANKVAAGQCSDCLHRIYNLASSLGLYKDAAETAAQLAAIAPTPVARSAAEFQQAGALLTALGDKPKTAKLAPVEQVLKAAIADDPHNISARYFEGRVLAQMGAIDDAKAQFAECIKMCRPDDPTLGRMKRFAAEPELSYQRRAPAFVVTALDGSKFSLDEMGGRVVLIDFWATWCGPCNEELPHMKRLAKDFAGQPLVILSISWDSDEAKWKQFIQKNEMTWAQYRDADHKLTDKFGISAIPHYFTIDSDGVLTSEMLGSGSDVEGKLKKLIAKAKAEHPANETVAAGSSSSIGAASAY